MFGETMGNLTVQSRTESGSFDTLQVLEGQQHTSSDEPWSSITIILPVSTTQVRWLGSTLRSGTNLFRSDMAIDEVQIAAGRPAPTASPTVQSPPATTVRPATVAPRPAPPRTSTQTSPKVFDVEVPGQVFRCDFTTDCNMSIGGRWIRTVGSTTTLTGPTTGFTEISGNPFAMIDSNNNSVLSESISTFITPSLNLASPGFVSFFFHMHGPLVGELSVQQCIGATCVTVWSRSGPQQSASTDSWIPAVAALAVGTTTVRFISDEDVRCIGAQQGNVAVDQITIATGTPPPVSQPPTAVPAVTASSVTPAPIPSIDRIFDCTFINPATDTTDSCGMNLTGRWTVNIGSTPSSDTGPISGESGEGDAYAFIEATGGSRDVSFLTTSVPPTTSAFVSFFFHVSPHG